MCFDWWIVNPWFSPTSREAGAQGVASVWGEAAEPTDCQVCHSGIEFHNSRAEWVRSAALAICPSFLLGSWQDTIHKKSCTNAFVTCIVAQFVPECNPIEVKHLDSNSSQQKAFLSSDILGILISSSLVVKEASCLCHAGTLLLEAAHLRRALRDIDFWPVGRQPLIKSWTLVKTWINLSWCNLGGIISST